jgi:hypothetical protein
MGRLVVSALLCDPDGTMPDPELGSAKEHDEGAKG